MPQQGVCVATTGDHILCPRHARYVFPQDLYGTIVLPGVPYSGYIRQVGRSTNHERSVAQTSAAVRVRRPPPLDWTVRLLSPPPAPNSRVLEGTTCTLGAPNGIRETQGDGESISLLPITRLI